MHVAKIMVEAVKEGRSHVQTQRSDFNVIEYKPDGISFALHQSGSADQQNNQVYSSRKKKEMLRSGTSEV